MRKGILTIFLLHIFSVLLGQNISVTTYTQSDYRSATGAYPVSPQVFDMEQDSLGRIFLANASGVLWYDGIKWGMVGGTKDLGIRNLVSTTDQIVYAGGKNAIGYFELDTLGDIFFRSLLPLTRYDTVELGNIQEVLSNQQHVYFRSEKGLFIYNNQDLQFVPFISDHHQLLKIQDKVALQDNYGNLLAYQNNSFDTLMSIANGLEETIMAVIKDMHGYDVVFTSKFGIYRLDDHSLRPWARDLQLEPSLLIKDVEYYRSSETFVIATYGGGLIFLNHDGQMIRRMGIDEGLTGITCYDLYRDINDDLWVCLDNGVAKMEYPPVFDVYNNNNGLTGIVLSVAEYQSSIMAGSTNGLFQSNYKGDFDKIGRLKEVWDIKLINGVLWVASESGLYQFENNRLLLVGEVKAKTIASSSEPDKIWVGLADGLASAEIVNNRWQLSDKFPGIAHEVRTIAQASPTRLWVSYEQASRVEFDKDLASPINVMLLDSTQGFSDDFYFIESYYVRNQALFATGTGLYTFDEQENQLVKSNALGERFVDVELYAIAEDSNQDIWLTSDQVSGKLSFVDDQIVSWDTLALTRLGATDVWRAVPTLDKHVIYYCTTDGLFGFNVKLSSKFNANFSTLINQITINRDSVISKFETMGSTRSLAQIPYRFNDIRFSFAATSYNYEEALSFSYLLDGFDEEWSSWSDESFKDFTNLSPGAYWFQVKAKNSYGIESAIAQYKFVILPPWYQTTWAYLLFALLLAAGVFVVDRYQRKRLSKKQQEKLRVQEEKLAQEREITAKLRKVDKLKDEFLANTSHELRTPLNGIIGIAESLFEESQKISKSEMQNNLAMVIASGKRLASMVDSILDYSKLKTKSLDLHTRPIDLHSIVEVVLAMSKPIVAENKIKLVNGIDSQLPMIEADENKLQQILYNLVGNAIKFTEKGKIELSALEQDGFIEICIQDEGIGIPEDKLGIIFDSYEQADVNIDTQFIGTGLGLSITKKLVALHNGTITVASKVGEGSKFCFTMPISTNQERPSEEPSTAMQLNTPEAISSEKAPYDEANFNILIVDDEPINQQVLLNQLKHEPYNLELAANGSEALDIIEQKSIDLVLLDVMMPHMSGFEVCQKIREQYTLTELPVIFITAKDQVMDLVDGLQHGGNDYITKPFSKQEIIARVRTHLHLYKINDSYSRFIPFEFLESLGKEAIMEVNLGDHIEKNVTLMFSDIRDYTALSEDMTPNENFEFLNSFLSKISPVIRDNNGFIMHYLGDGLMSIFLHDPADAINASIDMLSKIQEYNDLRKDADRKEITMGIGLHTGKLVLGVLGSEGRLDLNVVSDSVNTASRMEGLTKTFGASIIISEETLQGLDTKTKVNYRALGWVTVKGKSKPIEIFEVLDGLKKNELKIATKSTFEAGLAHYYKKDFISAASDFKQVATMNPDDVSADMYLKLAAKYMVDGVPEAWSGVEVMANK